MPNSTAPSSDLPACVMLGGLNDERLMFEDRLRILAMAATNQIDEIAHERRQIRDGRFHENRLLRGKHQAASHRASEETILLSIQRLVYDDWKRLGAAIDREGA